MKVSIVVTSYNKAEYTARCIKAILDQDFTDKFEVILADDCSTDSTEQEFFSLKDHPNFSLVTYVKHSKNKGLMRNFIWAISKAQGEYIALCDGDDMWSSKDKLSKQISFLESNKEIIGIGCNEEIVDTRNLGGNPISYNDLYVKYDSSCIVPKHHFLVRHKLPFHTSTLVFRNANVVKKYLPRLSYAMVGNDIVIYNILNAAGDLYFLDESLVTRNHNPGGITTEAENRRVLLNLNLGFIYSDISKIYLNSELMKIAKERSIEYLDKSLQHFTNRSFGFTLSNFTYYLKKNRPGSVFFFYKVVLNKLKNFPLFRI